MDDVLAKARDLAEAIRTSDRFTGLRKLEEKIAGDEETQNLTRDLQAAQARIEQKERETKPVEVEEKRELARLQEKFRENKLLMDLVKAQADFHELMNGVNRTIHDVLDD
jgi:cell fate (sporulation/competence/biofilm development) regulator YlbF (YheA/YmcA/DUF963 family)